jgi:hypothetical protein
MTRKREKTKYRGRVWKRKRGEIVERKGITKTERTNERTNEGNNLTWKRERERERKKNSWHERAKGGIHSKKEGRMKI